MPFKDTELELERIRQLSRDRRKRFRANKKDLKIYIDNDLHDEFKGQHINSTVNTECSSRIHGQSSSELTRKSWTIKSR